MAEKTTVRDVKYKPKLEELKSAHVILKSCQRTLVSLLEAFDRPGGNPRPHRAPTDPEQDILRAMVLFASAGTDAMAKQVVTDCLRPALKTISGAKKAFTEYVGRRIVKKSAIGESVDVLFLSEALTNERGPDHLVELFSRHLVAGSLQSTAEFFRVAAVFGVEPKVITTEVKKLDAVFAARNYIAHEMDVDFSQPNRSRRPRKRDDMVTMTNLLLGLNESFLRAVDSALENRKS